MAISRTLKWFSTWMFDETTTTTTKFKIWKKNKIVKKCKLHCRTFIFLWKCKKECSGPIPLFFSFFTWLVIKEKILSFFFEEEEDVSRTFFFLCNPKSMKWRENQFTKIR